MMKQRMKMVVDVLKKMENGQPSTSQASLVSPLPGTQRSSASKAGLVHVSDISPLPVLGISRSERSCTRQRSVMFTATPMKDMLEEAELKRQVKGNTGNTAKEENPKKQTKASTQNNERKSGNTRQEGSKRKNAGQSRARRDLFERSSVEEDNEDLSKMCDDDLKSGPTLQVSSDSDESCMFCG
jgi:hypothetical protein